MLISLLRPRTAGVFSGGGGATRFFEMDFSAGAAENAGWVTAQSETYKTRTHNPTGGVNSTGSYTLSQVVGDGDNYWGWSDRTTQEAVAGETRIDHLRFRFPTGQDFGGGTVVDKIYIPHDSTNGQHERGILQISVNSSTCTFQIQHDGGDDPVHITAPSIPTVLGEWIEIRWLRKYSTSFNAADGGWKVWINNDVEASPDRSNMAMIQNVPSGGNADLKRMGYVNTALASGTYVWEIDCFFESDSFEAFP